MATIELSLSSKIQKETSRSEVLIRFYEGKKFNLHGKSGVFVDGSNHFEYYIDRGKTEKEGVKIKNNVDKVTLLEGVKRGYALRKSGEIVVKNRIESEDKKYHDEALKRIEDLKNFIINSYNSADKESIKGKTKWLEITIEKFNHPEKYIYKSEQSKKKTFFELFTEYIEKQQHSYDEIKGHYVISRLLQRYQHFVQQTENKDFTLDIETFNAGIIEDFESYARNEYELFHEYSSIFNSMPKAINEKKRSPEPQQRGDNTIIKFKKKLNAFFHWLNKMEITQNRPFEKVVIGAEKYGTPYYLTLEERNIIADYDFSYNKHLDAQRDIFIFQCLIGCRVGDLVRMTKNNVINGAVEYIPNKTKDGRPNLVRVPLNDRAKAIINKYKDIDTPSLFPFISTQKYNDAIKDILTICKINRMVTILNPTTGNEEQQPINEIASSHMARRTFIGNLYKKVKDPNLVGSLSGHKEGSKAFVRYRDIDEDMKKDLVKLID